MFSTLRNRFGIPGVISVIALVFAMLGGAYAASDSSGGGKATASKAGKRGPKGPKGATGPAGPQGPAGPKGDAGAPGANGSNGAPGANGKPVVLSALNPGQGGCDEGGTSVEVKEEPATKKSVCNGIEGTAGADGADGEPWTAGGILPSTGTLTGAYGVPGINSVEPALGYSTMDEGDFAGPLEVSFSIPVVPAPTFVFVPGIATGFGSNAGAGCPGVTAGNVPQAASGKFCVYGRALDLGSLVPSATVSSENPASAFEDSAEVTPAGALLKVSCDSSTLGICYGKGLWAVTGS